MNNGLRVIRREFLRAASAVLGLPLFGHLCQAGSDNTGDDDSSKRLIRPTVNLDDLGAVGDGVTDDTRAIAIAFSGSYQEIYGTPGRTYLLAQSVSLAAGVLVRDMAIRANGDLPHLLGLRNGCTLLRVSIECASNSLNSPAANRILVGVLIEDVSRCKVTKCIIRGFLKHGIFVHCSAPTMSVKGHCISHNHVTGHRLPDGKLPGGSIGIFVANGERPPRTDIHPRSYESALRVSEIEISNNYVDGSRYGIAAHTCAHVGINNNSIKQCLRGISIQHGSTNIIALGNHIDDCGAAGLHVAHGCQYVQIIENNVTGTMAHDNVAIQTYYGCEHVRIVENHCDSEFDRWDGPEFRAPGVGIRVGQFVRSIEILGNHLVGYSTGIALKSTIYEQVIKSTDSNYFKTGYQQVLVSANHVRCRYLNIQNKYASQISTKAIVGVMLSKSAAWESLSKGGLQLSEIVVESNSIDRAAFPFVIDDRGPLRPDGPKHIAVQFRSNASTRSLVGRGVVFRGTAVTSQCVEADNSWDL